MEKIYKRCNSCPYRNTPEWLWDYYKQGILTYTIVTNAPNSTECFFCPFENEINIEKSKYE